jgi:hypothetical protein
MLTRRGFEGIASCAITGFVATNLLAAERVPMTPGLTGQEALSVNRWRHLFTRDSPGATYAWWELLSRADRDLD